MFTRWRTVRDLTRVALAVLLPLVATLDPDPATAQPDASAAAKQVLTHIRAGEYAKALPHAERLLAITKANAQSNPTAYATGLEFLGTTLSKLGRYSEAEPNLRAALTIREKELGPDSPRLVSVLDDLATVCDRLARYPEAEKLYKRSLAIEERANGVGDKSTAITIHNLGSLYAKQGRTAEAETEFRRSLAIKEAAFGVDHAETRLSLHNLGLILRRQARFEEAFKYLDRALSIGIATLGPNHPSVATMLESLGTHYFDQGRLTEGRGYYERAIAIAERALGSEHPTLAGILSNQANVLQLLDQPTDAEKLHRRSLAIREKSLGPNHPDVTYSLGGLASLLIAQDRRGEAQGLLRRALGIEQSTPGRDPMRVVAILDELAGSFQEGNLSAEAEPLRRQVLALLEKIYPVDHPQVAAGLSGVAFVLRDQGRWAEAEPLLLRVLAIREKHLAPDSPEIVTALRELGRLRHGQQRYQDAAELFGRAVAILAKAGRSSGSEASHVLSSLGLMEIDRKRWLAAHQALVKSVAIERERLSRSAKHEDVGEERFTEFDGLVHAGWGLAADQQGRRDALTQEAFEVAQWRDLRGAGAAIAQMAARLGAGQGRLSELIRESQDLARRWDAHGRRLTEALGAGAGQRSDALIANLRTELDKAEARSREVRALLQREHPDYSELSGLQPISVESVKKLLGRDEAMLVLRPTKNGTYAWVITREATTWRQLPIDANALTAIIATFRKGLDIEDLKGAAASAEPRLFDLGQAHELYATLVGPVEAALKGKQHLIVVPSGALTGLPFHLLVTEKPAIARPNGQQLVAYGQAAWLIRRHAVSVIPSVSSLRALRAVAKAGPSAKPMVGFGNPTFQPASAGPGATLAASARGRTRSYASFWRGGAANLEDLRAGLSPLPETAAELRTVAKALGATLSDIHLGPAASETTVKRTDLAQYGVVYFATHGLVAGEVRGLAEPALALTLPSVATEIDDGLLTASEVAQLKLKADWVVLSACNTAAGDRPGAEALSGLARAFFYAGARALLVSHWRIDSEAAVRLTTSTFANLQKDPSLGRAEALRRAMLAMTEDTSSPWNAYPDYWAAFSVVGEGGK